MDQHTKFRAKLADVASSARLMTVLIASLVMLSCTESNNVGDVGTPPDSARPDAGRADAPEDVALADSGPSEPRSWCDRLAPATLTAGASPLIQLSEAHALVRHFGAAGQYSEVDRALTDSLQGEGFDSASEVHAITERYAAALPGVCVTATTNVAATPMESRRVGNALVVTPGTGVLEVPDAVDTIIVDLRDALESPTLRPTLTGIVAAALAEPVDLTRRWERRNFGPVDEVFGVTLYEANLRRRPGETLEAGARRRALVFIIGARVAPTAAQLAGSLRLTQDAWIVGEDIATQIAESDIRFVGDDALAVRTRDLIRPDGDDRWPDTIPADAPFSTLSAVVDGYAGRMDVGPLADGIDERAELTLVRPLDDVQPVELSRATARAALVVAHGVMRTFFPYFDVVGDHIDERLREVMSALESSAAPTERADFMEHLGRLTHALEDGHVFLSDRTLAAQGNPPFYVDFVGDTPVINSSLSADVQPGDALLEINGVDVGERLAEVMEFTAAASIGYQRDLAFRKVWRRPNLDPIDVVLRDPAGEVREVRLELSAGEDIGPLITGAFIHPTGWLDEVGAPDVFYLNLDGASEESRDANANIPARLREASGARALIIDMRGYPGTGAFTAVAALSGGQAQSPFWRVPEYHGPTDVEIDESEWTRESSSPVFEGPTYLVVGPRSVSAAETISQCIVAGREVTVVGRPSAATNGNISGTELPGGFTFSFTAMEVLNRDGTTHHGVGIPVDIVVEPSASAWAEGRDVDVAAALDHLNTR